MHLRTQEPNDPKDRVEESARSTLNSARCLIIGAEMAMMSGRVDETRMRKVAMW